MEKNRQKRKMQAEMVATDARENQIFRKIFRMPRLRL
jgi:hypothetical protein